jgi:hypothetical protein
MWFTLSQDITKSDIMKICLALEGEFKGTHWRPMSRIEGGLEQSRNGHQLADIRFGLEAGKGLWPRVSDHYKDEWEASDEIALVSKWHNLTIRQGHKKISRSKWMRIKAVLCKHGFAFRSRPMDLYAFKRLYQRKYLQENI